MRVGLIAILLGAIVGVTPADPATSRQCKRVCPAFVAACRTETCSGLVGRQGRRCRKTCRRDAHRECRRAGIEACSIYYAAVDLGTLGGERSEAFDVNEHGDVVGLSTVGRVTRAFLHSGGVMEDLGTLGGTDSMAMAINDSGDVAGWSYDGGELVMWAFLYRDGVMTHLGFPLTGLPTAMGLNNAGRVVASSGVDGPLIGSAARSAARSPTRRRERRERYG